MQETILVIADKNYSLWPLAPWLCMKKVGMPFTEKLIRFGSGRVRGYGASVEVDVSAGRPSFRHVSLEAIEGGANNRRDIA